MELSTCSHAVLAVVITLASWPQWGGMRRDFTADAAGYSANSNFAEIQEMWRIPLGLGHSGICVDRSNVFTMFHRDGLEQVVAVSARDGQVRWTRSWTLGSTDDLALEYGPGPHSTPVVVEDRLFCIGLTGRLMALDADTGRTLWQRELWDEGEATRLERGFAASPIVVGDGVIVPVGGRQRSIRCFALGDGKLLWQRHDYVGAYASPVLATLSGEPQIIQLMDQHLVALRPATGELLWEYAVPTERYVNCTSPVVAADNWIYINTGDGLRGLKIRRAGQQWSIEEMWASPATICQTTNFVHRDHVLYGSKEGGVFVAIDALTGTTFWRSRELRDGSSVVVGDLLVVLQERGELAIAEASPQQLTVLWRRGDLQRFA